MKIRDLNLSEIELDSELVAPLKAGLTPVRENKAVWTESYAASGKDGKRLLWTESYSASGKGGKPPLLRGCEKIHRPNRSLVASGKLGKRRLDR